MRPLVADLERKCAKNVSFSRVNIDAISSKAITRQYGVSSIPHYVLVDSSGKVVQHWIGTGTPSKFDSMLVYCPTQ